MPNPRRVVAAVEARIARSSHVMTLHYPRLPVTIPGVAPVSAPVSPLVQVSPPTKSTTTPPTTVASTVSFSCLFTPMSTLSEAKRAKLQAELGGWNSNTKALARVAQADVELSPTRTVFDGVELVDVNGVYFRVLNWIKLASSWDSRGTYYVFLGGK